jgi:hypothetical protein
MFGKVVSKSQREITKTTRNTASGLGGITMFGKVVSKSQSEISKTVRKMASTLSGMKVVRLLQKERTKTVCVSVGTVN